MAFSDGHSDHAAVAGTASSACLSGLRRVRPRPIITLATYAPRNYLREIVVDVRQAGIESIVLKTSTRDGDGG